MRVALPVEAPYDLVAGMSADVQRWYHMRILGQADCVPHAAFYWVTKLGDESGLGRIEPGAAQAVSGERGRVPGPSGEAILRPRIGRVGVAAHFPEAEDVAVDELDVADELRPLPRVAFGQDDARGAAMLLRERLAVP